MLLIPCPWCGPRDESEFHYGGQAHVPYPEDPSTLTDEEWARYLFFRDNPKGPFAERWTHTAGCRRWFNAVRDTSTNEILTVYRAGEERPETPEPRPAVSAVPPDAGRYVSARPAFEDEAVQADQRGSGGGSPQGTGTGRGGGGEETQPLRPPPPRR
ncbi:sarcosine oxidase subunit delta, partial [Streptomyces sp. NPDC054829]